MHDQEHIAVFNKKTGQTQSTYSSDALSREYNERRVLVGTFHGNKYTIEIDENDPEQVLVLRHGEPLRPPIIDGLHTPDTFSFEGLNSPEEVDEYAKYILENWDDFIEAWDPDPQDDGPNYDVLDYMLGEEPGPINRRLIEEGLLFDNEEEKRLLQLDREMGFFETEAKVRTALSVLRHKRPISMNDPEMVACAWFLRTNQQQIYKFLEEVKNNPYGYNSPEMSIEEVVKRFAEDGGAFSFYRSKHNRPIPKQRILNEFIEQCPYKITNM